MTALPNREVLLDLAQREVHFVVVLTNVEGRWYLLERKGSEKRPVAIMWGGHGTQGNRDNPKTCSLQRGLDLLEAKIRKGFRFHRTRSGIVEPGPDGDGMIVPFSTATTSMSSSNGTLGAKVDWSNLTIPWGLQEAEKEPYPPLYLWDEPFCDVWQVRDLGNGVWEALDKKGELVLRVPESTARKIQLALQLD